MPTRDYRRTSSLPLLLVIPAAHRLAGAAMTTTVRLLVYTCLTCDKEIAAGLPEASYWRMHHCRRCGRDRRTCNHKAVDRCHLPIIVETWKTAVAGNA